MPYSKETKTGVYIGLGSNLEDPLSQVGTALLELAEIPQTQLVHQSSLYKSKPMGPKNQDDYINCVVELSTQLPPISLLNQLQKIENEHGRVRNQQQWGSRTLDLDILLYAQQTISNLRLTVPHYGIKERMFVLLPLSEIAPTLKLPDNTLVSQLVASLVSRQSSHEIYKL